MAQLVAKVIVEDLPLYKDMATFILTLAQGEDKNVPPYVQQRANELALQLQAMLAKKEQPDGSNS